MGLSGFKSSIVLAALFIVGAGLPGFVPLSHSGAEELRLYSVTELKAGPRGHFITRAEINNRSIDVLVDTGASAVALSFEDAEKVGLKPRSLTFDVPINTANGQSTAARVLLRAVEIDGVRVRDVEGLVLQKGAIDGTLLGMSFLGRLKSFSVEQGTLVLKN